MAGKRATTAVGTWTGTVAKWVVVGAVLAAVVPELAYRFALSSWFDDAFVGLASVGASVLLRVEPEVEPAPAPLPGGANANEAEYDYRQPNAWVAHPHTLDWADLVPPDSDVVEAQAHANADVFFIYPTGYFGFKWNAPAHARVWSDPMGAMNDLIADSTSLVHASIYNGAAKVYVPRYRQATAWAFMMNESDTHQVRLREAALERAYVDVERAFDAFLHTRGDPRRPIIVAGHSQGSILGATLLKRRFSGPAASSPGGKLRAQLVAAYLIGAALVEGDAGPDVHACTTPLQLGCFVAFNAFLDSGDATKFVLRSFRRAKPLDTMVCVNPLTWDKAQPTASANTNPGSRPFMRPLTVLRSALAWLLGRDQQINVMSPLERGLFGATCDAHGVVRVGPTLPVTGFASTGMFAGHNLHGAESSLFWKSQRDNVDARVREWLRSSRPV